MATTAEIESAHLLRRTGFGASSADIAALANLDRNARVDWVLDTSANPPAQFPAFVLANGGPDIDEYQSFVTMRRWWLDRMASIPRPFHEKLTFFWHGHFATSFWKLNDMQSMMEQNAVFRANAFGSFETLAQTIAIGPAMLLYLDNASNYRGHPNENFAREDMELFTLGVDNGYTQADVVGVARAWTGHNLQWPSSGPPVYHFYPGNHDTGLKSLFGLAARNWDGPEVITEMVNGSLKPRTALHIARKLWSLLGAPRPQDATIQPFADAFAASGMNITALLRAILTSDVFYSDATRHGLVRTPVDWGVSLLRATGARSAATDIDYGLSDLGQGLFEPPTVAGWKMNDIWISENGAWQKAATAARVADVAVAAGFLSTIDAMTPAAAVDTALDALGTPSWSVTTATKQALAGYLQAERTANGTRQRRNLIRLVSLTPEHQLA